LEKGLFMCALKLARWRGRIVNARLLVLLEDIIRRLLATIKMHILQVGETKARRLSQTYEREGVFRWAPEAEAWLREPKAILYLGVTELFGR